MPLREHAGASFRIVGMLLVSAMILVGCGAHGVQIDQSPLLKLFEIRSGLISYLGTDGNIHTIDQKGGSKADMTRDAGARDGVSVQYGLSTWSPDGKSIAFPVFRTTQSGSPASAEVVTANRGGEETARFLGGTSLVPIYISWDPDSSRIAILSSNPELGQLELGIGTLAAASGYTAVDSGAPYYWDWLPVDHTLIAHVNSNYGGGGAERLTLVNSEGLSRKEDLPVSPAVFQAPDLTRDGKYLAYVSTPEGIPSLLVRELRSSTEQTLTRGSGPLYFAFSPEGKRMAVLHASGLQPVPFGTLEILTLGDEPAGRMLEAELVLGFFWSPDGKRVAYIVAVEGAGADDAFLQEPKALYVRLMVLDVARDKSWTVATYPPTREFMQLLPFLDQYLRSITPWSPDGKHIVFTAYSQDGTPSVYVAHAEGGIKPRLLTQGDAASWSWR